MPPPRRAGRSRHKAALRSLAVVVAGVATAALSVAAGAGGAAAASAPTSCAAVTGAVRTYAAGHHETTARSREVMREARALCIDPRLMHSTGRLKVSLTADDQLSVSADTTTGPTAACTADVESQLPAVATDVGTAVDDACTTQEIDDATVAVVSAAATGTDPAPGLPSGTDIPSRFPTGAQVYQVTAGERLCGLACVWYQHLKELYFIQYDSWDWHHLAGYDWSYVNCDDNGGVGFTVKVNKCFWGGPNPGYHDNPISANVDFHVSFLFHGFPISIAHSITLTDYVDGQITPSTS